MLAAQLASIAVLVAVSCSLGAPSEAEFASGRRAGAGGETEGEAGAGGEPGGGASASGGETGVRPDPALFAGEDGAVYRLLNGHRQKCADVQGGDSARDEEGAHLVGWDCSGASSQLVRLRGQGDWWQIHEVNNETMCWDVSGEGYVQWSCHGGLNQQFKLDALDAKETRIVSRETGRCARLRVADNDEWISDVDCSLLDGMVWIFQKQ